MESDLSLIEKNEKIVNLYPTTSKVSVFDIVFPFLLCKKNKDVI